MEDLSKAVRIAKVAGADHARRLDQLCRAWYAEAFRELAAATGTPPTDYVAPRIRWVAPAVLDRPRKERDGCGATQWILDRLGGILQLFSAAGGRVPGWRQQLAGYAARLGSVPYSSAWTEETDELLRLTRDLAADMREGAAECGTHILAGGLGCGLARVG